MMPFHATRRVEFGDTDMAGIMHFSNFFRFMEAAETEFLRSRGLSVSWTSGAIRYGFPRVSVSCDYHKPARFEDLLTIAVIVEKIGQKSIRYRYEFTRNGEAIATGRITAVFCHSTDHLQMESQPIPDDLRSQLEA
jgi:YbgC/YbaW family acyl-CoA thioester hydrolase